MHECMLFQLVAAYWSVAIPSCRVRHASQSACESSSSVGWSKIGLFEPTIHERIHVQVQKAALHIEALLLRSVYFDLNMLRHCRYLPSIITLRCILYLKMYSKLSESLLADQARCLYVGTFDDAEW